jgi:hypothetical protein
MSVGAIIIIAIAATGVLLMRFRKRWLAKINIAFTNRITGLSQAGFRVSAFLPMWVGRRAGSAGRQ